MLCFGFAARGRASHSPPTTTVPVPPRELRSRSGVLPPPSVKKGADGFDDIDDFWATSRVPGTAAPKAVVSANGYGMERSSSRSLTASPPRAAASASMDYDDNFGDEDDDFGNDDFGADAGEVDSDASADTDGSATVVPRGRTPAKRRFKRPPGRAKKGMEWDYDNGVWKTKGSRGGYSVDTAPRNQTRQRVRHTDSIEKGRNPNSSFASGAAKKRRISWAANTPGDDEESSDDAVTPAPRRKKAAGKKKKKPAARTGPAGQRRSSRQRWEPLAWWANERPAFGEVNDMDTDVHVTLERSGVPTPMVPKAQRRKWDAPAETPVQPKASSKRKRKGVQRTARGEKTAKAQKRAARRVVQSSSEDDESEEEERRALAKKARAVKRVATTSSSAQTDGASFFVDAPVRGQRRSHAHVRSFVAAHRLSPCLALPRTHARARAHKQCSWSSLTSRTSSATCRPPCKLRRFRRV